ncbi:Ig-like domain-containing protein [Metabacillus sediminilitoris]|uniref:Bacterial Ig domain-containing protein n=1 Tax=Metabacillus sediminilitoris TaxID=2567941 RepID=A0A4S4BS58_9BACI|nr:Ig-like domain-containing protein [Metabacillus sediminilitoris]QGQ44115.1 hypothetical protein GMB29_01505 [Metabacillus sediminilitoris]THF75560.1 hypothetical protein E6W99_23410 [Metabacillus sediminilitoris]
MLKRIGSLIITLLLFSSAIIPSFTHAYENTPYQPPLTIRGTTVTYGVNSGKGRLDLQWTTMHKATHYSLLLWNGKQYDEIPVGLQTSWTSQGKGIFPTEEEITSNQSHFHIDGNGEELADDPRALYMANEAVESSRAYRFKVRAYYPDSTFEDSPETIMTLQDVTAPSAPEQVRIEGNKVKWTSSQDNTTTDLTYQIKFKNLSGSWIDYYSTKETEIEIPDLFNRTTSGFTFEIIAKDQEGNYSKTWSSFFLPATTFLGYSIPNQYIIGNQANWNFQVKNNESVAWTNDSNIEIQFYDEPELEGVRLQLNNQEVIQPGQTKTFSHKLSFFSEGNHTFSFDLERNGQRMYVGSTVNVISSYPVLPTSDFVLNQGNIFTNSRYVTLQPQSYSLNGVSLYIREPGNEWMELPSSQFLLTEGDGEKSIEAKWVASWGAESAVTRKVLTLDQTPPVLKITRLPSVVKNSVAISGHVSDNHISQVTVTANGLVLYSGNIPGDFITNWDTSKLPSGNYPISVITKDLAGNLSTYESKITVDHTPPVKPTTDSVTDKSTVITGKAEPLSTITIKRSTTSLVTGTAGVDGKFSLKIPVQKAGTLLTVYSTDLVGNQNSLDVIVKDVTAPTSPVVDAISNLAVTVTGKAEANASIIISNGTKTVGSGKAASDGKFKVTIPKQTQGTKLTIIAKDSAGNSSKAISLTVIDKIAPSKPILNSITYKQSSLTGKAETFATISVYRGKTFLKSANVTSKGTFSVSIGKQKRGTVLTVYAKDASGNISSAASIKVK